MAFENDEVQAIGERELGDALLEIPQILSREAKRKRKEKKQRADTPMHV